MAHGGEHVPTLSFFDRNNVSIGELGGWVDLSASWKWNKVGSAVVVTPDLPEIFPELARCRAETVMVKIDGRIPWSGRVVDLGLRVDRDKGIREMELTMVDDWVIFQALLARQNPLAALANQGAAEFDERTGPAETIVKQLLTDVAARLGLPMMIAPAPDPDPSPVVTVKARMDTLAEILPPLLDAASLGLFVHLHRKGGHLPEGMEDLGPDAEGKYLVEVLPSRNEAWLSWDEAELVKGSLTITSPGAPRLTVGGAGEGIEKVYSEVVNPTLEDSLGPYRLREAYLDDADGTKTEAELEALSGGALVDFEVDDGVPWWAGEDFRVGDFAGGTIGGVDFRSRIEEIELVADDSGTMRYVPKIGKASPPPEVAVALAVQRLTADLQAERRRR